MLCCVISPLVDKKFLKCRGEITLLCVLLGKISLLQRSSVTGMLRECYGNVTGMLRECYGNATGMLRECYGNAPGSGVYLLTTILIILIVMFGMLSDGQVFL